jgi:RNA polymerase sigma factor (sigma-70 family)
MIELLCRYHDDWIRLALSLGAGDLVDDIVHDMYLKVDEKYADQPEKIMRDGTLNTYFVYVVLRNMIYDIHRAKSNAPLIMNSNQVETIMNQIPDVGYDYEDDADTELRLECTKEEIDNWHWYNQKLWKTYHGQDISMRKLSEETRISLSSIFNTIKNGRQRIKKAYKKKRQTT